MKPKKRNRHEEETQSLAAREGFKELRREVWHFRGVISSYLRH